MHYCCASIKLAGGHQTIVPRDTFNPVSWPEIEVIRAIHGDDSVVDVKPFVKVEQTTKAEKQRLIEKYGPIVEDIFPGKNPQMEMEAAGVKLPTPTPVWKNPVDVDPAGRDFEPVITPPAEKATKEKPAATPFV